MTKAALEHYQARMLRVLDHIDQHLDDDLSLAALGGVAAFSKHHFHRQFTATFGLSVHRYVQLARLKRASHRLAFGGDANVTEIALDAGYEAPDAFARAFRQRFGQSPSAFRDTPDWEPWLTAFGPFTDARSRLMKTTYSADDVTILETRATPVAVLAHRGDPSRLGDSIRRFIDWRRRTGARPPTSPTFTLFHAPEVSPPDDYHIDLCAGIDHAVAPNDEGVEDGVIPAGRCAVLRVIGSSDDLRPAARYLYADWLPASGEALRDFPLYAQRVRFFPDVPEHEAITDLFLPLRSVCEGRKDGVASMSPS